MLNIFSGIHDQKYEDVCWAYAISTMLRASIRSTLRRNNIINGLATIEGPEHHKMMRKELTMNIFPFGNEGTDPSTVIKLVWFSYLFFIKINFLLKYISVNNANKFTRCRYLPALLGDVYFETLWLWTAAFRESKI